MHDGKSYLVAAAADGAGSADRSQIGADHVCSTWLSAIAERLDDVGSLHGADSQWAHEWLEFAVAGVRRLAQQAAVDVGQFAATALCAAISEGLRRVSSDW